MAHTYPYARPALTVDIVVFALDEHDLQVMLIQRDLAPFAGNWALPGGFVRVEETLDAAAAFPAWNRPRYNAIAFAVT